MWSTPSSDTSSREPSHVNHDRPAAPPTGHPYVLRENRSLWCFGVGLSVSLTVWGDYFICCPLVEIHVFLGKTGLCGDKHFFFQFGVGFECISCVSLTVWGDSFTCCFESNAELIWRHAAWAIRVKGQEQHLKNNSTKATIITHNHFHGNRQTA